LLVSVLPQTAVESDTKALVPVLEDLQERELLPEEMLADTSYGSDDNVQRASELGVEVISPVPGPQPNAAQQDTDSEGEVVAKLTIDDFAVDERTGKVEACPAGRIPLQVLRDEETGTTTIHMSAEDCQACEFREQCPIEPGQPTCKVSYTDKQKRLEGRRREQETDVFRQRYAKRSGLEGTNSGVKRRLGLGKLRVRGRRAVFQAIFLKVAGWNLLRAAASGKLHSLVAGRLALLGAALGFCLDAMGTALCFCLDYVVRMPTFVCRWFGKVIISALFTKAICGLDQSPLLLSGTFILVVRFGSIPEAHPNLILHSNRPGTGNIR
jgi:hypothetical protein